MPIGASDDVIFGSPELSEFCWSSDSGAVKRPGFLRLTETCHGFSNLSLANNGTLSSSSSAAAASACTSGSSSGGGIREDPDAEGADILNLISTSLDRFNALLHTDNNSSAAATQSTSSDPRLDVGIPIPLAYSQFVSRFTAITEDHGNSLTSTWGGSDCPRSASPNLPLHFGDPRASNSCLSRVPEGAKLRTASPPGLPCLLSPVVMTASGSAATAASSRLLELAALAETRGNLNSRSHHDQPLSPSNFFPCSHMSEGCQPDTCSSMSDHSIWESQSGAPQETTPSRTNSAIDLDRANNLPNNFASWWSTPDNSVDRRGPVDLHSSFDFGYNGPLTSSSTSSLTGIRSTEAFPDVAAAAVAATAGLTVRSDSQQQLLLDIKAALRSPADVPVSSSVSMLRSMFWSSWSAEAGRFPASTGTPSHVDSHQAGPDSDRQPRGIVSGKISGVGAPVRSRCFDDQSSLGLSMPSRPQSLSTLSATAAAVVAGFSGRRKTESVSYSSSTAVAAVVAAAAAAAVARRSCLQSGPVALLPSSPTAGIPTGLRPNSSMLVGQLGSPPQQSRMQSRSYGTAPQKFSTCSREIHPRVNHFTGKAVASSAASSIVCSPPSGTSQLGTSVLLKSTRLGAMSNGISGNHNKVGHSRRHQNKNSASSISGGSTSSNSTVPENSGSAHSGDAGKPVIAKWRRACSFYLRGHCKKEDCEFAHDLTKVTCKFWELGECFKGSTCPFLHGYPPELLETCCLAVQDSQQPQGASGMSSMVVN